VHSVFPFVVSFGVVFSGCFYSPNLQQKSIDTGIAATIVNISFVGMFGRNSRGSGTMIHSSGIILTNAHIIPADYSAYGAEYKCLISVPDPKTGEPVEIYYGKPIVVKNISTKYDLAFVQIEGVYYDKDARINNAVFPKHFVSYDDEVYCRNNKGVVLGDKISVFGYPDIGGGKNLIITEGIVSGFNREKGWIFTSAKMSHGNSGGLAVDGNGCMIGVPAKVNRDDLESMGIVLSSEVVGQFCAEIFKEIEAQPKQ